MSRRRMSRESGAFIPITAGSTYNGTHKLVERANSLPGALEVRPAEIRLAKIRPAQVLPAKQSLAKVRPAQVGLIKVVLAEIPRSGPVRGFLTAVWISSQIFTQTLSRPGSGMAANGLVGLKTD